MVVFDKYLKVEAGTRSLPLYLVDRPIKKDHFFVRRPSVQQGRMPYEQDLKDL